MIFIVKEEQYLFPVHSYEQKYLHAPKREVTPLKSNLEYKNLAGKAVCQ